MQEINEQFNEELKKMQRKITCVDCNSPHAHWATLRRGFFLCTRCAKKKLIRKKGCLISKKNECQSPQATSLQEEAFGKKSRPRTTSG